MATLTRNPGLRFLFLIPLLSIDSFAAASRTLARQASGKIIQVQDRKALVSFPQGFVVAAKEVLVIDSPNTITAPSLRKQVLACSRLWKHLERILI